MDGVTLKSRAVVFALCAGGVAFFLALLSASHGFSASELTRALIPAIICGAFSWASAERSVSATAAAIDAAIARLARAGEGDLESPMPPEIAATVPTLARAMEVLFRRLRVNLDSIERLAMYDSVTGLPNRTYFRHRVEQVLAAAPDGRHGALLFLDLDRFKAVNDTKGHATGDQLLGRVAERLLKVAERSGLSNPLVGRLAGDEFTIFLPGATEEQARALGEAALAALSEPFTVWDATLQIGASIGVALRPTHGDSLHDLMRAADVAMYHAKESGRGRVELYGDLLATLIADRVKLDAELRDAVDQGQFALMFQPQRSLRGGGTVAAEALLRWRHPTRGLRLPGSFIDRAEETGLIVEIGDVMIDEVGRTLARWGKLDQPPRLAINVSQRQLDDTSFFRRLRAAITEAGASLSLLELELGESLAMKASDGAIEAIATLREAGARLTVDGFGAGHSNLRRLRALPLDRVKLDRALIADLGTDESARLIAQALVGLIHGLGCEAVGEGVETEAQAEMLRVIGCDVIQGYAVAPPMDEAAFLAWAAPPAAKRVKRSA